MRFYFKFSKFRSLKKWLLTGLVFYLIVDKIQRTTEETPKVE